MDLGYMGESTNLRDQCGNTQFETVAAGLLLCPESRLTSTLTLF
jgi:hypothetical protein